MRGGRCARARRLVVLRILLVVLALLARKCGLCGMVGHTKGSCGGLTQAQKEAKVLTAGHGRGSMIALGFLT